MKRRRVLAVTVGVMVLSVGLVLTNYGDGVTPAWATPPTASDPHAGLPQNWDQIIPAATRFVVLSEFGGAAVRDNETGLVWEKATASELRPWSGDVLNNARIACATRSLEAGKAGGCRPWQS